ncbi:von Willebrand factor type A [Paenibacillus curdlanolyticus YK9]|uniref:von Willebrand factor type A n=1 Tax=Paenibacillus curdlanolyticus YK9 TaxID=717606 RepID=E0IA48_9BACL|nr:VWA domain-containing protein [Paenibacillus curdlanolyticus]EFM10625.1 von Willebrand factor type A [Paenibacillus curdlanolyticus YK9]
MKCSQCGVTNESTNHFCKQCGNDLTKVSCQQCGTALQADSAFCGNCGTPRQADSPASPNEQPPAQPPSAPIAAPPAAAATPEAAQPEPPVAPPAVQLKKTPEAQEQPSAAEAEALNSSSAPATDTVAAPRTESVKKKPWIWIASAAAAVVLIGLGFYLFASNEKSPVVKDEHASAAVSDEQKAEEAPKSLKLAIDAIDASNYPTIKVKLAVEDGSEQSDLSSGQVAIKENTVAQKTAEVNANTADKTYEIVYDTTVSNTNPPNGEQRVVDLVIGDNKLSESYKSPSQKKLHIDDVSYNTDEYPKVNVYFSLYDENNQLVEDMNPVKTAFTVKEGDKETKNASFSKLTEKPQAISTNLVIDVSDSMSEDNKLTKVKDAATQFLSHASFASNDVVGLMSFSDASNIRQSDFTTEIESIKSSIAGMQTSGCTALYEALNQAVSNTAYNSVEGSKYVVVFTDGKNTICDGTNWVSPSTVINNALQWGVPIYAIGVEEDADLQQIAEQTNGQYHVLGNDFTDLNAIYSDIYTNKKKQYVITYDSSVADKSPRQVDIKMNGANLYSKASAMVTPKLLDNRQVSEAMQNYQIAWSQAMNAHSMDPLLPYVTTTTNAKDKSSVFNIVDVQINGDIQPGGTRTGGLVNLRTEYGEYVNYDIPDYKLVSAKKISDDRYQLRVEKRVRRDALLLVNHNQAALGLYDPLTTFKETAYTYNVIKSNGAWKVSTVEDDEAVPVCYVDASYQEKYVRADGKSSKTSGNCPGAASNER